MPYIYSTVSADVVYTLKDDEVVTIAGGAGVSNKHLWTPRGVSTQVTDGQLAQLKKNPSFANRVESGFFAVENVDVDPAKVAKNMTKKDKGAQLDKDGLAKDAAPIKAK